MAKSRMTSKGQVTVPKSVRERLGLRTGDRLDFKVGRDGSIVVKPCDEEDRPRTLAGFLNGRVGARGTSLAEMRATMAKSVAAGVVESLSGAKRKRKRKS